MATVLAAEDFPPLTAVGPCHVSCPAPLPRAWARVLRGSDAPATEPLPACSSTAPAPEAQKEAQDEEGSARRLAVAAAESALPVSPAEASPRSCHGAGENAEPGTAPAEPEALRARSDPGCTSADAEPSSPREAAPGGDDVSSSSADEAPSGAQPVDASGAGTKESTEHDSRPSVSGAGSRPFAVIRDRPGPKIPGRNAVRQASPDHFRLNVPRRGQFALNQRGLGRSHTSGHEHRRPGPDERGHALWNAQRTKSMDDQSSSGQSSVYSWHGARGGHRSYGTKSSYFTVNNWLWESSEDVPSPASNHSDLSVGQSCSALTPFVLGTDLLTFIKLALKQQIEYYFSIENLSGDMFLRSQMDPHGFVHVDVIACFNRVRWYCAKTDFILEAMEASDIVEVEGSLMRRRHGWSRWVLAPEVPSPQSSILEDTASDSPDLSLASD